MVKRFLTALVFGLFLSSHAPAQEVFVGEQKASPKYPKAEIAKAQPAPGGARKTETATHSTTAANLKAPKSTVTKATPGVIPGQRAPAATPSPIVKPEPPLVAKTQSTTNSTTATAAAKQNVPAAAIPPPSKSAPVGTKTAGKPQGSESHQQPTLEVATTKKASAKVAEEHLNSAKPSVAAKTSAAKDTKPIVASEQRSAVAVAPPAEGPTHDVVMSAKRSTSFVGQNKSPKSAQPVKVSAPAVKAVEETEEEERTTTPAHVVTTKTIVAPSAAATSSKKISLSSADAHSIASVPSVLQTRKEPVPALTKVSLVQTAASEQPIPSPVTDHFETAFTKLADGFDFPVGRPDAQGYYKARGFRSHGHLGEDWDGVGGGDTDLNDPIFCIADGLVVFARDCHMGWGNVIIVRHSYREGGMVKTVDSLYGHLNSILVHRGQAVARGQKIANMGTAHGLYDAHLHLEIRKNIEIGMSRTAFAQDFSNYYDPSTFIQAHRRLQSGGGNYRVAMNTFTRDSRIRWDKVRNYSHAHTGGGTSESSAALKRALATKSE